MSRNYQQTNNSFQARKHTAAAAPTKRAGMHNTTQAQQARNQTPAQLHMDANMHAQLLLHQLNAHRHAHHHTTAQQSADIHLRR
jgi:hypothetical protein